jgi:hypothetical protein
LDSNEEPYAAVNAYARSISLLSEIMEGVRGGEEESKGGNRRCSKPSQRGVVAREDEVRRLRSIVSYSTLKVISDINIYLSMIRMLNAWKYSATFSASLFPWSMCRCRISLIPPNPLLQFHTLALIQRLNHKRLDKRSLHSCLLQTRKIHRVALSTLVMPW